MLMKRFKTGGGAASLITAVAIGLAGTLCAADDQAKPIPAKETTQAPSQHLTQTLTIKAPLVAVRSNPGKSQQSAPAQAGQYAFVDAQGNVTSTPRPGTTVPDVPVAPPAGRGTFRSPTDPNATFADTRHIRAAVSVRVNEDGTLEMTCRSHSDSPDHTCSVAAEEKSAGEAMKEDR